MHLSGAGETMRGWACTVGGPHSLSIAASRGTRRRLRPPLAVGSCDARRGLPGQRPPVAEEEAGRAIVVEQAGPYDAAGALGDRSPAAAHVGRGPLNHR
jgi:hypothetical protein